MRSRDSVIKLHRFHTEEKRRQVNDIDQMIKDLMRKYDDLEAQVKLEEGRNGIHDPAHFSYSTSAKAVKIRADNLLKSVSELKDQLSDAQLSYEEDYEELKRLEIMAEKENVLNTLTSPMPMTRHAAHSGR